jgi:hypothetical protein
MTAWWADVDPQLHDLLAAAMALRQDVLARTPGLAAPTQPKLAAVGWSTVDIERAAAELVPILGSEPRATWRPLPRDSLLGATARALARGDDRERGDTEPDSGPDTTLVLLEPDTEGPLAASLARHGEGLAVIWLRTTDRRTADANPGSRAGSGPFGPAALLPGPRWGPHAIVLGPRATIGP